MLNKRFYLLLCFACFIANMATAQHALPKTGIYGDWLTIATTTKGEVFGKFDYRNDQAQKRCIFYFYGSDWSHDTLFFRTGLPGVEITSGTLVMHGHDSLTLFSEFSVGYLPFNFRKVGYSAGFRKELKALALGIVKEEKCTLYSKPENTAALKSAFTNGNFVTILQRKGLFVQAQYTNAGDGITTTAWIKTSALYEADPMAW